MAFGLLLGCGDGANSHVTRSTDPLIYGEDDRLDWYALDDERLRDLALESTVAQIPRWALAPARDGAFIIDSPSLDDVGRLCATEAFATQPAAASCSGVLVTETLVLTAGHCVGASAECDDQAWVFGYALTEPATTRLLEPDDVYGCRAIAARAKYTDSAGRRWDHALVELDRPVVAPRRPVELRVEPLLDRAPLFVIGFPSGLPVKVDAQAQVVDARTGFRDYFELISDASQGSSGAGVFDAAGRLSGILVRGGVDFEYLPELDCFVSRRIEAAEDIEQAEQASYARAALSCACRSGWDGGELCTDEPCLAAESKEACSECSETATQADSGASASCTVAFRNRPGAFASLAAGLLALALRRVTGRNALVQILLKVGGPRSSNCSKSATARAGGPLQTRHGRREVATRRRRYRS